MRRNDMAAPRAPSERTTQPCDPVAKRSRMLDLSRGAYVSHSALEGIVKHIRDHGLPEFSSRTTQWRYRKQEARRSTPYGPIVRDIAIPQVGDDVVTVSVQDPYAMLYTAAAECAPFAALLRGALENHPSSPDSPWQLIVYCDEIGHNPLLTTDPRKSQCIYWSLLEFGCQFLACEDAWFVAAAVRSTIVEEIESGMSQLMRIVLTELFFNDVSGHNFSTGGATLQIMGMNNPVVIFAKIKAIIADEKALKELWGCLGASAFKFCGACANVVKHTTPPEKLGSYLPSTCLDLTRIREHTDDTVRAIVRELRNLSVEREAGRVTTEHVKTMQYHYGYKHLPNGLLQDEHLAVRGRSNLHYDYYHIYFVSGIFQKELQGLTTFLAAENFSVDRITAFLKQWEWPRTSVNPSKMFADWHINSDHIKCDAHVCTTSYEILAFFVSSVIIPSGVCVAQCTSFLKLCDVVDLLMAGRHGNVDPKRLLTAIVTHLCAHLRAYGILVWVPKFHASTHLANQVAALRAVVGCNIHEIRHKLIKRWTRDRFNTAGFESGCIEEVTLQHLYNLKKSMIGEGLVDAAPPTGKLRASMMEVCGCGVAETARVARTNGRAFSAGDFAFVRRDGRLSLARMLFHVKLEDGFRTCLSELQDAPSPSDNEWCQTFRQTDNTYVVDTACLVAPVTHYSRGNMIVALVPAIVRMQSCAAS
jgi:hypothetical protein